MPSDDVSDLRDVVDAINKLCDTMKTSYDDREVGDESTEPTEVAIEEIETRAEKWTDRIEHVESVTSESERFIDKMETIRSPEIKETISIRSDTIEEPLTIRCDPVVEEPLKIRCDPIVEVEEPLAIRCDPIVEVEEPLAILCDPIEKIETVVSDSELVTAEPMQYESTSEIYFTASSEVSLLSDMDVQERLGLSDDSEKRRDDRNSVIAGHVAAMREHFESMTRTNTPCPDQLRSSSPSIEVFRTVTNSPDI